MDDAEDGTDTVDADTVDTADSAVEGCFDGFLLMSHRAYEHDPVLYNCLRRETESWYLCCSRYAYLVLLALYPRNFLHLVVLTLTGTALYGRSDNSTTPVPGN